MSWQPKTAQPLTAGTWQPKTAQPMTAGNYQPRTAQPLTQAYKPERGYGTDLAAQAVQGATFGLGDEATAALSASMAAYDKGRLGDWKKDYEDSLNIERGFEQDFQKENPVTSIAAQLAGGLATGLAGGATNAGTSIANSLRSGNLAARAAKVGAIGAASGGAYGFGTGKGGLENRLDDAKQGALIGGAASAAFPLVGAAAGSIKNAIAPRLAPETADLARKAVETYNIPLSRSQVGDSRFNKVLSATVEGIPLSGAGAFQKSQQTAFNKALAKVLGGDADKLSPEFMASAAKNIGQKFDDVLAGQTIKIDDAALTTLANIEDDASRALTGDHFNIVKSNINKLISDVAPDGTISGEKINSFRSALAKVLRQTNNDATGYLSDLQDAVIDISVQGVPEKRALLNTARNQWRSLKTLEPLAAKSQVGDISPAALLGSVTSDKTGKMLQARGMTGDLGELARIGQAFLKPQVANSGTPERLAAYGLLGTPAMFIDPITTLASTAGTIGGARAFNALNTSQNAMARLLRQSAQHAAPAAIDTTLSKAISTSALANALQGGR